MIRLSHLEQTSVYCVMLLAKILHRIAPWPYQSLEAGILGRPGWVVLHVTHLCAQRMLDMRSTQAKTLKTQIIVWGLHGLTIHDWK